MVAFADALVKGALPALRQLHLFGNHEVGYAGMAKFAEVLDEGALPSLKQVSVGSKHERDPQLVAACEPRGIAIG